MNKKPWQSKTMIFGFVTALSGALAMFIPWFSNVQPFMTKNEATLTLVWGLVAMILRTVTKDKIQLGE